MDMNFKKNFTKKWKRYFPGKELPIACYYADETHGLDFSPRPVPDEKGYACIFRQLAEVRRGTAKAFYANNLGCAGAKLNLGFDSDTPIGDVAHVLADIERYKKSMADVRAWYKKYPPLKAPGRFIVFKRWDLLDRDDVPQVVSFFGNADTIAGLHVLANFNTRAEEGVIAPFGSGCDTLVVFPLRELYADSPKAVLSGFDPSCRRCGEPARLIFSVPWPKFTGMAGDMDKSFLTTGVWEDIKLRCE